MLSKRAKILRWAGIIFASWLLMLLLSFSALIWQLKTNRFSPAVRTSYMAEVLFAPVRVVTLYSSTDVEAIQKSLVWLRSSVHFMEQSRAYAKVFWMESAPLAERQAKTLSWQQGAWNWLDDTTQFSELIKKSHFYGFVPEDKKQFLEPQLFADAKSFLTELSTGQKAWLILFQNTDELRATGGFMGSYARISFSEGMLVDFEIQDIYQPDGQFKGFVAAPKGVTEFLSSGKGMRLPDANWWSDFPRSAQTILQYFAFGKEQRIMGVVAVNLQLAEDVLRVFGPVVLSDYDVTVTADNISRVARADRVDFFPGSKQKAHFLTLLFNQIKLRAETAEPEKLAQLLKLWHARLATKDWQWYSPNETLQQISQRYGFSGAVSIPTGDTLFFESVESNVGINKANAGITRTVDIQLLPTQIQVLMQFTNHQAKPIISTAELRPDLVAGRSELQNGLGYVNYQRFLISPYLKVVSIFVGDQSITNWDEETIVLSGVTLKQVGFVMAIPEASKQRVQAVFELDGAQAPVTNLLNLPSLTLEKQAGLPATPYEVFWAGQRRSFVLENDITLPLQ
jgi:hypothetical protein